MDYQVQPSGRPIKFNKRRRVCVGGLVWSLRAGKRQLLKVESFASHLRPRSPVNYSIFKKRGEMNELTISFALWS